MEIIEYVVSRNVHTGKNKYLVEISEVSWYMAAWYAFWEKLDPCCRKPWWLWYPLVRFEFSAHAKKHAQLKNVIEVDREWALTHYPWDITTMDEDNDV